MMFSFWKTKQKEEKEKQMASSAFVNLTRVYKMKDSGQVKTQPVTISKAAFASVRPSNRLAGQRSTLTTLAGDTIELAEIYSDVQRKFGAR